VPNQVTYYATPWNYGSYHNPLGFFVQDQWTVKRLTINPGVRLDWFKSGYDAADLAAGQFVPARSFPRHTENTTT